MAMKILLLWTVTLAILYQKLNAESEFTQLNHTNGTNPSSNQSNGSQFNSTQTGSTVINVTQINNYQEDDIEDTGRCGLPIDMYKNCPANTCGGRCGDRANYTKSGSLCSCDNACTIYGDCCRDYKLKCGNYSQDEFDRVRSTDFTCKKHAPDQYIFMKETCKPSYSDESVIRKCYTNSGFEGMVPVSDPNTEIVYSNYFCALCNYARDIVPWKLTVMCKKAGGLSPGNEIRWNELILLLHNSRIVERRCDLYTQPQKALESASSQKCVPINSRCSLECRDPNIIELCKEGEYDPQYGRFEIVQNKYCLQCQNHAALEICPAVEVRTNQQPMYGFSYSLLLNVVGESVLNFKLQSGFGINKINTEAKVEHDGEVRLTACGAPLVLLNEKCELDGIYIAISCNYDRNSSNVTYIALTQDQRIRISEKVREIYDAIGQVVLQYFSSKMNGGIRLIAKWYVHMPYDTDVWRSVLLEYEKPLVDSLRIILPGIELNECIYTKAGSTVIPRKTIDISSENSTAVSNHTKTIKSGTSTVANKSPPEFIILILTICAACAL
ncbi:unnamed protein product [Owenia fusiformis]|uniref:SMB domain-containing protein n=1 Tax=Owenia fusiformis TaxID=6347 RepID=A0A8S4N2G0_OWEFU|nr:unnamed protein product [Owenia fusiformis]